ncbi:hypothetical protein TNIN_253051 [Trichonephila inaurata madagascariensis]|uniref:Uncharacterized protein n=1 Tax=Trichonephila inaurata madagascariensis TaxID=2747483 RepID=A0A8X6YPU3_9ARAC|nr:hypothetical protein TNIN_253051 [Trichonephila inaurata madagascariensis]
MNSSRTSKRVTDPKWQRWSTPFHQRTPRAPPVAERRSSSNWEMKIMFVDMTRSSSSWPRGVSLVPPRVTRMWSSYPSRPPGRHPARSLHLFQNFLISEACLINNNP